MTARRGRHRGDRRAEHPQPLRLLPVASTGRDISVVAARVYLTVMAGLLFWSLAPMLVGWRPVVVRTGSMQPAVRPGDILLVQHVPGYDVRPGQVVLAADPGNPGRLLSHRVIALKSDGDIVTRGDANRSPDSTPLRPSQVKGIARLSVPFIGRPAVWWWAGRRAAVAGWLVISAVAVVVAGGRTSRRGRRRRQAPGPQRPIRRSTWPRSAATAGIE